MPFRNVFLLFLLLFTLSSLNASVPIEGAWQGILYRKGTDLSQGTVFYLDIKINGTQISGLSREEVYDSPSFSIKKISGVFADDHLIVKQQVEVKSDKNSRGKWCKMDMDLTYDEQTGYLSGDFVSSDCKRVMGSIILYQSDFKLENEEILNVSQVWVEPFIKDFKNGLDAPLIRKKERDNFVFEPIFFDFDKSEIRPEHYAFLDRMIRVIKGHSDLRVNVTGHTDADGSFDYNDGLSKRRADAIIAYFVAAGIDADRIVIDFKGERSPIDTNTTKEGKQRNRRVDFKFI